MGRSAAAGERADSLADGAARDAGEVTLSGGASANHRFVLQGDRGSTAVPVGMWSDDETLWVADAASAPAVLAYRLSDGARRSDRDIAQSTLTAAGNTLPAGLWSDGETLWVADSGAWKVFAYRLADKVHAPEREFELLTTNCRLLAPSGLWSDGETMLASLYDDGVVRSFALPGGAPAAGRALDVSSGRSAPLGIWSNRETLWVVFQDDPVIRAWAVPGLRPAPDASGGG